jgi:hypothetical protein
MIILSRETELTEPILKKIIDKHKMEEMPRLLKL